MRRRLVLTLLFLGAVGLQRTWDLRGYTADGLALLTGRTHAYGYRYTEAFLSQVAHAGGAEPLTDMLGHWTTQLWHPPDDNASAKSALTCYIDGHRCYSLLKQSFYFCIFTKLSLVPFYDTNEKSIKRRRIAFRDVLT